MKKAVHKSEKDGVWYEDHLREEYLIFLQETHPIKGARILEVGPGGGAGLRLLHEKGFDVVGLELNRKQAQFAKKNSGVPVRIGDVQKIPFPDASFDSVILSHVLEHVEYPITALMEIRRVLRMGGSVFLSVPNRFDIFGRLRAYIRGEKYIYFTDPTHKNFYTLAWLARDTKEAGLFVRKVFGKSFIPLFLPKVIPNPAFYRFLGTLPILKHLTTGNMLIAKKV